MSDEKQTTFSGSEFIAKLRKDALTSSVSFTGMVKPSESGDGSLMFAPGTDCSSWIEIPADQIASVEILRVTACKDHSHPFVKLSLNTPATNDGKLFLAVAQAHQRSTAAKRNPTPSELQHGIHSAHSTRLLPLGARVRYTPFGAPLIGCGKNQSFSSACVTNCECDMGDGWVCCQSDCCD